jgi:hypothetical protein
VLHGSDQGRFAVAQGRPAVGQGHLKDGALTCDEDRLDTNLAFRIIEPVGASLAQCRPVNGELGLPWQPPR